MNLNFSLLIVDDNPDSITEAINLLRDHLEDKGFALKPQYETDFLEQNLRNMTQQGGRNYDLVIIDYSLGEKNIDGAKIAKRLRTELPYTEMVFYSADSAVDLLGKLAERGVSGVFAEQRGNLDSALTGLADRVIGKAIDLNHMRGIAMAEVAEMDLLMEETLARIFRSNEKGIDDAGKKTIRRLRQSFQKNTQLLTETLSKEGLSGVVENSLLFSSASKYQAIMRVARLLTAKPSDDLEVLRSYENDIIKNRNMLAHVKEETAEDGATTLRPVGRDGEDVHIDDDWMECFRRKLKAHRSALTVVCAALDQQFGVTEAGREPEEHQP